MKDAPAFDFYPERFWFAVEGWTEQEVCRYWRLLGHQWMRQALPADQRGLEGLARGRITARLMDKFPVGLDGLRRNPFMETIRAAQRKRRQDRADGAAKTNAKRWPTDRSATRSATVERQLSDASSDSPPLSPLPVPHVLLEKEPKGADAPPPHPIPEMQALRLAGEEAPKRPQRPSGRAALRAEAETTSLLPLPRDLASPEFRDAWGEWCQHRTRLAGQGKPWSALAARSLLRQCCDNGEAWATAELRQALASGWQGVQWDQRRNPADVRSKPMVPGNGHAPPAPCVNRWAEDHLPPTERTGA